MNAKLVNKQAILPYKKLYAYMLNIPTSHEQTQTTNDFVRRPLYTPSNVELQKTYSFDWIFKSM